ncbi:swarming motility protein YbiA [Thecamonas trahens ATCC 50062]|uniref:Swarming motility protein YbiA n=1 Tax=Thecamonas trahens ATCC 50062 TaxID=461836 RepID=A0A0L0D8Z2_THETB|nr:swarming motility protein YbiA [Thecamonas trahens ATCC 50062]KNC48847.1 swarming motility protein YbiA [Thecamonas trahens ATCC 50062]|eukprot:XP_013758267.1 swarming motility protein YbiA [Thecamonas trahens ATCC 50062]
METLPETLPAPLVQLDPATAADLVPDAAISAAAWYHQAAVSEALFGSSGARVVAALAAHYPDHFVWATQFSNVHTTFAFTEPGFVLDDVVWRGPEQYFQAQKAAHDPPTYADLAAAMADASPEEAFALGRRAPLRDDWEDVKVDVMRVAVEAKFRADDSLRQLLLSTAPHALVQIKPHDPFWGTGRDGSGANMLGDMLMDLRAKLMAEVGE